MDLREIRRRRNEYVRARLKEQEEAEGRGFQARLAKLLDTSSAHVSNYINKGAGPTGEMGERVAFALWGLSAQQLDDAVASQAKPESAPAPPSHVVEADDEPQTWQALAAKEPMFDRLATARLGHAHTDEARRLVEAALAMAAKSVPDHYGGRTEPMTWEEAKDLYREAWEDLHDDPVPSGTPVAERPQETIKDRATRVRAEAVVKRKGPRRPQP